jgi:hypothetical protein
VSFLRIAAGLVALVCFFTSMAWGAGNLKYSGIPGKWQKAAKKNPDKPPDQVLRDREKEAKQAEPATLTFTPFRLIREKSQKKY